MPLQFYTSVHNEGLSPASCDHYVKLLRHALNLAIDWDMLKTNLVSRVPLFNVDNKVGHYMNDEELQRLLKVLSNDDNRPVCRIALVLLSTGARLNEVLTAEWQHVDVSNRVWRILAKTSKSKKMRSVPLNDSALDVLGQLDTEGEYDHLFINTKTGKPLHDHLQSLGQVAQ